MALKLKIRALFPAIVAALSPLTLVKNGLSYVFGLDITALRASLDAYYGSTALNPVNRIPLTQDTIFYFRSDGSNSGRSGLVDSAAGAFKDLQALWDYVSNTYDARGFKVTLQASGPTPRTMTAGLATNKGIYGANGPQNVLILGSATPSNFIISTTSADCISVGALLFGNAQFTIGGFKLQTTTGGNCVNVSGGGCEVTYGTQGYPIEFGACAQSHVVGNHNCNLFAGGAGNTVSGAALVHAGSLSGATTALHGVPIIFVGGANSLSFTNGFYDCESNATLFIDNITYTNIAAVNTGFASGLAASGGFIINYPLTSALPGNGAVAEIGLGKYLATGLENVKISDVTGMAAGVSAFLITPSSANLATALTNEDGTGVVPFERFGTVTIADQSGGGVTFSSVNLKYLVNGGWVRVYGTFTFSASASGANALIGMTGPPPIPNASYAQLPGPVGSNTGAVASIISRTVINSSNFQFYNNSAGGPITNAQMTGAAVIVDVNYPVS